LLAGLARHHCQFTVGLVEGDQRRVFLVDQEVRGVVKVPVTGLVDADQHRLEARAVEGIDNIARRLQRDFVLGRTATKNNPYAHLAHDPTSLLKVRLLTMSGQRFATRCTPNSM
jgi:hypothetical protein